MKTKKVLIALDYDPTAQKVAEAGYDLAKMIGAETTLVHVLADSHYYSSSGYSPIMGFAGYVDINPITVELSAIKDASQHYLDKTKKHLNDLSINSMVVEGDDSAVAILELAKKIHADVIVMGSHSRKWLEDIVMGSVTANVLKHAGVPLYIIPTRKHSKR